VKIPKHNLPLFGSSTGSNTWVHPTSVVIVIACLIAAAFVGFPDHTGEVQHPSNWSLAWKIVLAGILTSGVLLSLVYTHAERILIDKERTLWHRYQELPADLRADCPLSIETIDHITRKNGFDTLNNAVVGLECAYKERVRAERALDPTVQIVADEFIKAAESERILGQQIKELA
jgi:hypothetical protein